MRLSHSYHTVFCLHSKKTRRFVWCSAFNYKVDGSTEVIIKWYLFYNCEQMPDSHPASVHYRLSAPRQTNKLTLTGYFVQPGELWVIICTDPLNPLLELGMWAIFPVLKRWYCLFMRSQVMLVKLSWEHFLPCSSDRWARWLVLPDFLVAASNE